MNSSTSSPSDLIRQKFKEETGLEINANRLDQSIYSTDASNYQILPLAFHTPKNTEEIKRIVQFCKKYKIPIIPRGGGTSLVGQTIGEGIVLDFTKFMDKILEINPEEHWAWVEPGIVRDVLNQQCAQYGLHFAPDPATTSRAAVGGMIANNSSGTRSILYGKTLDHVLELEVLLDDGTILHCKKIRVEELEQKCELKTREGDLYRTLFQIVQNEKEEIIDKFPKVMRRVGGYNLDEFLNPDEWNLSRLFIGSEGTLGIILKAKINLVPNPKHQILCIVHFEDFFDSLSHVAEINKFQPAAVELLDEAVIRLARENLETKRYCDFIDGDPGGALVVEFYGNSLEEATQKANTMIEHLQSKSIGYAYPIFTKKNKIESIFNVRKKGLGLLMGVKGTRKPIAFIEDAAVPVEQLAHYIYDVFQVCKKYDTPVVAYAHASVGLLHVKPFLDLRNAEDIARMKKISEEVLALVKQYKGSWSGEHGDGLARGAYNEEFFGTKLYNRFIEIKQSFDPDGIMNPGKIVLTPKADQHLRYGSQYQDALFQSMFQYRDEGSFSESVHLCNGVGECRKQNGGTMCPSFRATKEEKDSTRGRANALRLALSGQLDKHGLDSELLQNAMDLCLSCKACKSECPSNVDMSKLKAEVQHVHNQKNGINVKQRFILWQNAIAKLTSGPQAKLINVILKFKLFRSLLQSISGLDARRVLPLYAEKSFVYNHKKFDNSDKPKVVFLADSYVQFHEPQIGVKAVQLLESLGYNVEVATDICCQRPLISKGLLQHAKDRGAVSFSKLSSYLQHQIPVVVCEPSCATAFKDDLPDLFTDPLPRSLQKGIYLIEDFIVLQSKNRSFSLENLTESGSYLLHGHCHQKAIFTTSSVLEIFRSNKQSTIKELNTGCCGMAGSFGYEKEHFDLSKQIADSVLIPSLNEASANTKIIATGFSCRHQIKDFSNKQAKHWLEYCKY